MPKSFNDRIKEIQSDPDPAHTLHNQLQDQAIKLILKAVGTQEWNDFIANFVDGGDAAQLARLKLEDNLGQNDVYIRKAVAYLIANSTCGGSTPERLNEKVNGILDVGMS